MLRKIKAIGWSRRDWIWTTMILVTTNIVFLCLWLKGIEVLDGYFSTLANAISIGLAVLAISIALKQNNENLKTGEETRYALKLLSHQFENVKDRIPDINDIAKLISDLKNSNDSVKDQLAGIKDETSIDKEELIKGVEKANENLNELEKKLLLTIAASSNSLISPKAHYNILNYILNSKDGKKFRENKNT